MASLSISHLHRLPSLSSPLANPPTSPCSFLSREIPTPFTNYFPNLLSSSSSATAFDSISTSYSHRFSSGSGNYADDKDDHDAADSSGGGGGFREAVLVFNGGDYYKCHDILESLWNEAQDPSRTLIHGILQCAVGFHHLFNQNHRGAMMELGEGLCKLRKMNFESGPFLRFERFEREILAVLDFIYQTQLELAACTDDFCVTLDQSERSYQLLGGYAAGECLYGLESDQSEKRYIVFCPERSYEAGEPPRVKLPTLDASAEHLKEVEYDGLN